MTVINLLKKALRVAGQSFTAGWMAERRTQSFLFTRPWSGTHLLFHNAVLDYWMQHWYTWKRCALQS